MSNSTSHILWKIPRFDRASSGETLLSPTEGIRDCVWYLSCNVHNMLLTGEECFITLHLDFPRTCQAMFNRGKEVVFTPIAISRFNYTISVENRRGYRLAEWNVQSDYSYTQNIYSPIKHCIQRSSVHCFLKHGERMVIRATVTFVSFKEPDLRKRLEHGLPITLRNRPQPMGNMDRATQTRLVTFGPVFTNDSSKVELSVKSKDIQCGNTKIKTNRRIHKPRKYHHAIRTNKQAPKGDNIPPTKEDKEISVSARSNSNYESSGKPADMPKSYSAGANDVTENTCGRDLDANEVTNVETEIAGEKGEPTAKCVCETATTVVDESPSVLSIDTVSEETNFDIHQLSGDLSQMLENNLFSDVLLQTCDFFNTRMIPAHRVVLAARSPVFYSIFCCETNETKFTFVEDTETVKKLLLYIYTNQLDQSMDLSCATKLLRAAHRFQVSGLKRLCERRLIHGLTDSNVIDCLVTAHECDAKDLKEKALNVLVLNKGVPPVAKRSSLFLGTLEVEYHPETDGPAGLGFPGFPKQ